ncbi:MAG: hypothetical protein WDW38_008094 [Sanguina aurantia]
MAPQKEIDPFAETGRYIKIDKLGQGNFGTVVLARNLTTGELVACKLLKRTDMNKYVEGEIINHSLLRHPHVIQFKEVFLTPESIVIVMEHASGGSLFSYVQRLGRLREGVARWFFQQLVLGLDYCHKRGVANRDIKLENTLLQEVQDLPLPLLKICDFGLSKADSRSSAKSKVGTYTYMAPEVMDNRDGGKYNGKVADIWSSGIMLYVMLVGSYPFKISESPGPREVVQMLERMEAQHYTIPTNVGLSPEVCALLKRMLLPDPSKRISIDQVVQDPWFTTNLPPDAVRMNSKYLSAPFAAGYQTPEAIRAVLDSA